MDTITITHDHADGTLVDGDPRPHHKALKDAGFRYSRSCGWYIQGSRDRAPQTWRIEQAAAGLRAAGLTVEIEIDDTARSIVEREADRAARSEDRADALTAKAERLDEQADATLARARQMAAAIPLGQPMMPDHYSYRSDRSYRDRMGRTFDRGFETARDATETARRADAAVANQAQHVDAGTTLRRIEKLEAEARDIARKLERYPNADAVNVEWRQRMEARAAVIAEDVAYWQAQVAESGAKLWGPDDFTVGDRLGSPHNGVVKRVNKKSLTVEWDVMPGIPQTVAYHKVRCGPTRNGA